MKFLIALFALVAFVAANPVSFPMLDFTGVNIELLEQNNKGMLETMGHILCLMVCEAIQITLDMLVSLGLQVILSACKFKFFVFFISIYL